MKEGVNEITVIVVIVHFSLKESVLKKEHEWKIVKPWLRQFTSAKKR